MTVCTASNKYNNASIDRNGFQSGLQTANISRGSSCFVSVTVTTCNCYIVNTCCNGYIVTVLTYITRNCCNSYIASNYCNGYAVTAF